MNIKSRDLVDPAYSVGNVIHPSNISRDRRSLHKETGAKRLHRGEQVRYKGCQMETPCSRDTEQCDTDRDIVGQHRDREENADIALKPGKV